VAENISMIARKTFHPQSSFFWEKNQHCWDVWYAPNTDWGRTQGFSVYSMMLGCVWRNVLKRITQNLR
jgi:hypothetical protein